MLRTIARTLAPLLIGLTAVTAGTGTTHAATSDTLTPGRIVGPSLTVDRKRIVYTERGPARTRLLVVEFNDGRIVAFARCAGKRSRCWSPRRGTVRAFHHTHRVPGVPGEPGLILTD